jgi:dGTPase
LSKGVSREIGVRTRLADELYRPGDSARYVEEKSKSEPWRDEFRRDFARVIHCPSFRRLQGKTQIFPGYESDFFRNRLTHSLEVGQIAESIAMRLNDKSEFGDEKAKINPRICLTASLLHDIGHPPFGHNGEEALDECMREFGGFEGNAQTLRIVTQIEKKRKNPKEADPVNCRAGLNLTYRTLGAILKYDQPIASDRKSDTEVRKGYYEADAPIVEDIKRNVCPEYEGAVGTFKTIECQIMDIADDIAYSTYDIEDTFKAGFLSPSDILTYPPSVMEEVARKVAKNPGCKNFSADDVVDTFLDLFVGLSTAPRDLSPNEPDSSEETLLNAVSVQQDLDNIASDGYLRTAFTADLVGQFVNGINVDPEATHPQLRKITVDLPIRKKIEVLKHFTYVATIRSNRVAVSEFRGKDIIKDIFKALDQKRGYLLLPSDYRDLFDAAKANDCKRKRVICDFIAGMTDRYAIEFWGRLYSDKGTTFFKPL